MIVGNVEFGTDEAHCESIHYHVKTGMKAFTWKRKAKPRAAKVQADVFAEQQQ
jgi:hypothetical protein